LIAPVDREQYETILGTIAGNIRFFKFDVLKIKKQRFEMTIVVMAI